MRKGGALDRILKYAAPTTGDPGTDAMNAAAQAANGPAGMGLIQMPDPTKKDDDEKNKTQEALRMAHELDSKNKEINGLRQQLQEAKMDSMRTQLKADIEQEQTRMRESLQQEHRKVREEMRKEQEQIRNQIRAEQKELDKKQSELQVAEAQQKGNITAAKAQYQADYTAAEADHKAKIAIEQAQHQAQLDKDVSAHDVQIAQNKADSLMDIAQQTTDMYIKQTQQARSDADKYFAGQQQQFNDAHPAISPALQSRLDGAMKSVGRVGKSLNAMTGMEPSVLSKTAGQVDEEQVQEEGQQPEPPKLGTREHYARSWIIDSPNVADHLRQMAYLDNEISKLKATGGGKPGQVAMLEDIRRDYGDRYNAMLEITKRHAAAGDEDAKEYLAQVGDLEDSGWFIGQSDLDKIRSSWLEEQKAKQEGKLWRGTKEVAEEAVVPEQTWKYLKDLIRERAMYERRGTAPNWWHTDPLAENSHMNKAQKRAWLAAAQRGIENSGIGSMWGALWRGADDAWTAASDAGIIAGTAAAPFTGGVGLVGTGVGLGMKGLKKVLWGTAVKLAGKKAAEALAQRAARVSAKFGSNFGRFATRQARSFEKATAAERAARQGESFGRAAVAFPWRHMAQPMLQPVRHFRQGFGHVGSSLIDRASMAGALGVGKALTGDINSQGYDPELGWYHQNNTMLGKTLYQQPDEPNWYPQLNPSGVELSEKDSRNTRMSPYTLMGARKNLNGQVWFHNNGEMVLDPTEAPGNLRQNPYVKTWDEWNKNQRNQGVADYVNGMQKSGSTVHQFMEKWAVK